jgi:peptide/nickel transport system substrate-binding protein
VLSQGIDVMNGVVPKDADKVLEADHLSLFTYVTRTYGYIGWNCSRWPFDDARVRRAMAHAIDVEDIVESLFRGYAKLGGPQIISSLWASNPEIGPVEFDPDVSEELLEEAGWAKNGEGIYEKDGKELEFTLLYNSENNLRQRMCVMAQANLKEIGVKAVVESMEFNKMSSQLKLHEFQAYIGGMGVATKVDMKPMWHSTSVNGRFNYCHYQNERVDEIIDTARIMSDFEKARPLWYELQEIIHRDQPCTMLYEPRGLVAVHKRFQNVTVNALRVYANIDEWWVPREQRRFK